MEVLVSNDNFANKFQDKGTLANKQEKEKEKREKRKEKKTKKKKKKMRNFGNDHLSFIYKEKISS